MYAEDVIARPVKVYENFASADEVARLLSVASDDAAPWETWLPPDHVWYARTMNPHVLQPETVALMARLRQRTARAIRNDYKVDDAIYADTLQLIRWRTGDSQAPHADAEHADGTPHPFPWRRFGAILYLNDTYQGGEIYFPTLGLTPAIKPGTVAFFPSTLGYLHGVTPVTSGIRYTMCTFFTHDAAHHDGHPI